MKVKVKSLSRVRLFATPWTVAHQAPPSMGFSRQEYWSGLPVPSSGDLPDPGIEPRSPTLWEDALTPEPPGKQELYILVCWCVCMCVCSVAQSCLTLCYPMDCSPPGSSVRGISPARLPEWVSISFSRRSSWSRDRTWVPCIGRWVLYHWATWEAHISQWNTLRKQFPRALILLYFCISNFKLLEKFFLDWSGQPISPPNSESLS